MNNYAIYLPAINAFYPKAVVKPFPSGRPVPAGITNDDLKFWTGKSTLWNHIHNLHSIGQYKAGGSPKNALLERGKHDGILLGDSGGFQIGKGKLKGVEGLRSGLSADEAVAAWGDAYDVKLWIIEWLETYCTHAMTIDIPLWAMLPTGKESPFHQCNEKQILDMTVDNLKIIDERPQGRTKWLNVIQATNLQDFKRWWDAVKWFRGGGWALAGSAGWYGGLHDLLYVVLTMRDESAFKPGLDWLHVLGVSTPTWAVLLTAIMRGLQNTNPALRVSYDSASPFQEGGKWDKANISPILDSSPASWIMRSDTLEAKRSYVNGHPAPFGYSSPLGDRLLMQHLTVGGDQFSDRRIDGLTGLFLVNHNLWVYIDAFERANAIAFCDPRGPMPKELSDALDAIEVIFAKAKRQWQTELAMKKPVLDRVAKSS